MISNQAILFFIFTLVGLIIGLLFDFFRIMRKSVKTSDIITYFEDIIFWIITGLLILYSVFMFNNGEIRFFMFLGMAIGATLYMLICSSYVIKYSMYAVNFLKKIIRNCKKFIKKEGI